MLETGHLPRGRIQLHRLANSFDASAAGTIVAIRLRPIAPTPTYSCASRSCRQHLQARPNVARSGLPLVPAWFPNAISVFWKTVRSPSSIWKCNTDCVVYSASSVSPPHQSAAGVSGCSCVQEKSTLLCALDQLAVNALNVCLDTFCRLARSSSRR